MSSRVSLVALAVAVLALIVASYTVAVKQPAGSSTTVTVVKETTTVVASSTPPPPPPNVVVRLANTTVINTPGTYQVTLGWIYTDAPVVAELRASGTANGTLWFLIDGIYYGNPALATLDKGNHTIGAIVFVANATNIKIYYRVVG